MLSAVRYTNFKRYADVTFDVSKRLTVLVGPNSSGKSSLLKGLLAFKQTYGDTSDHAGFMSEGEYVDIGPFDEYVKDHVGKGDVGFIFQLEKINRHLPGGLSSIDFEKCFISIVHSEDPQSKQGRMKSYSVFFSNAEEIHIGNCESSKYFIRYNRMQTSEEKYRIEVSEDLFSLVFSASKDIFDIKSNVNEMYTQVRNKVKSGRWRAERSNQRGMIYDDYMFSDSSFVLNIVQNFLVQPAHSQLYVGLTKQLYALAGLRQKPTRSVRRTDESITVGASGQNTASVYSDLRQKSVKAGSRKSKARDDFTKLEKWLVRLNLARGVEVGSWRDLVDMRTRGATAMASDSVVDIGVGFSQAAPVLVQLAAMPEEAMLLIEQPELHLFPKAQTALGQIISEEVAWAGKRVIIETHSEHIIQGIQLHLSNGRVNRERHLSPSDVQILYVDVDSSITKLELDEFGEFITEWPQGFFDQTLSVYREIFINKSR